MGVKWNQPPRVYFQALSREWLDALYAEIHRVIKGYEGPIIEWMQTNATWKDRTGDARRGLGSWAEDMTDNVIRLWVFHSDDVPYGRFLEFDHQGRYAILQPAIDHFGVQIWNDIKAVVDATR